MVANILDVTGPMYIHRQSNHPPSINRNLPASISKHVSTISHTKKSSRKPQQLTRKPWTKKLHWGAILHPNQPTKHNSSRRHNIIWFNHSFSSNVATNIGGTFLKLMSKHFPKKSKLMNKIFNRNTVNGSYSCMHNIANIIKGHNKQIAATNIKSKKELSTKGPMPPKRKQTGVTSSTRLKSKKPISPRSNQISFQAEMWQPQAVLQPPKTPRNSQNIFGSWNKTTNHSPSISSSPIKAVQPLPHRNQSVATRTSSTYATSEGVCVVSPSPAQPQKAPKGTAANG